MYPKMPFGKGPLRTYKTGYDIVLYTDGIHKLYILFVIRFTSSTCACRKYVFNQRQLFKQVVAMAHNGQAFDHQFCLNYILTKTDLKPDLITRGMKKDELAKSSIQNLHPFVDKNGLLRINSRLEQANIPYDQKYPLILPQGHHITYLIIRRIHLSLLHAGPQAVLSHLRHKYWLTNGKRQKKR
ncbi:hypothetical protein NQ317_000670 [Molorchus minor]|uniref:Uncharacterized protein n=1 Tax=Molorchus minor TaxID=1323400 RepID=A0ABQ9J6X1_9CUCU|nr:hypothetical protein NQ317_000670 [Molorchus minor]